MIQNNKTITFIDKANKIHNNFYNYDKINYINNKTKVIITCPIHKDFEQTPSDHLQGYIRSNTCIGLYYNDELIALQSLVLIEMK